MADRGSIPLLATKVSKETSFMRYTVYVLYSEKSRKHYTGYTSDLEKRISSHNDFGRGWTTRYRPWNIIYTRQFESKSEAIVHEKWLKSGRGREFIKALPH